MSDSIYTRPGIAEFTTLITSFRNLAAAFSLGEKSLGFALNDRTQFRRRFDLFISFRTGCRDLYSRQEK